MRYLFFTTLLFSLITQFHGQNYSSKGHGNWTTGSKWHESGYPSLNNTWGTVSVNHDMTLMGNYKMGNTTNIGSSSSLTVSGNLEVKGGGVLNVDGDLQVFGDIILKGHMRINAGGSVIVHGKLTVKSSQYLTVGNSGVSGSPYADLVVLANLNGNTSGDALVHSNGRVAVKGNVRDNGGGGTLFTVQNQGQVYVHNNVVYSGGGSKIINNNSTNPYGLYVNGSITNSGGGATTTGNSANQATMVSTNPDFTNWVTNVLNLGPLPVTWGAVNLKLSDNIVRINWETVSEKDCDFFVIERSQDLETWTQLGEVSGAGESHDLLSYSFEDSNPDLGVNYYRIRQFDFNGDYSVSKTISINKGSLQELNHMPKLYPNPSNGSFFILNANGNAEIVVCNKFGKTVSYSVTDLESAFRIDIQDNPGMYFVTINSEGTMYRYKMLVR